MDNYASGGIGASIIVVVGIIYKLFHHFKCTSKCCDKETSLKINIDSSPPVNSPDASVKSNNQKPPNIVV
jgi:hypothetical protein